jgi:hypothetical protein
MNKWTIRELSVRYKLEPEIRDVFVEGKTDKALFQWFLTRAGCIEARVYSIECVEIPAAAMAPLGLSEGNKQRVIALAFQLNVAMGDKALQFTCIVDADEDRLLRVLMTIPQLLWTDFSSLEAYLFDEVHLTKFIRVALGSEDVNVRELLVQYGRVLTELFLIRAAARQHRLPIRWLPFTDCCKKVGSEIHLDVDGYLIRVLNASALRAAEGPLRASVEHLRGEMDEDTRHQLNGHDFIELLHWERRQLAREKELRNAAAVGTALMACFEHSILYEFPLFKSLVDRCSN